MPNASLHDMLSAWAMLLRSFQTYSPLRHGLLGDGAGNVEVAGKYGWSWIRYNEEQSKLSQVRNLALWWLEDGTPVLVGKRYPSDEFEQVLGVDISMYTQELVESGWLPYVLPHHGSTHQGSTGTDPAPIDLDNMVPGFVAATDPESMSVYVHGFYYPHGTVLEEFSGLAIDLTGYVPGVAGQHCYVVVYVLLIDGSLNAIAGASVPEAAPADIPDAPELSTPLGLVDLRNGMTTIAHTDIWQYKSLWGTLGNQVIEHHHSGVGDGGSSILGLEELMMACYDPITIVNKTIIPTQFYHELHIQSPMYADWPVAIDELETITPDPIYGCGQLLMIKPANPGLYTTYKIVVKHNVGNIWLHNRVDINLDEPTDHLLLIYDGTYWCDTMPSGAGGGMLTHNNLGGIQGGAAGDYWHFTQAIHDTLQPAGTPTFASLIISDGGYAGLGPADGRFVFTNGIPDTVELPDADLGIKNLLYHIGDPDTYLAFSPDFAGFRVGGVDFLYMTEAAQDEFEINPGSVDIDTIIHAIGVADALVVQGSDGQVTLGALGAGIVQSDAGGVLSSDYTIDSTITMASGQHFDPTDASGQDLGDATHRWDLYTQDVIFGGATGANVITVPDNLADALHIVDAGGADDYLTIVSTNAQRELVINQDGADIDFRAEAVGQANALFVRGSDGNVGIGTTEPTNLLTLGDTTSIISTDSADASDNKRIQIAGGGAASYSRGAYVNLFGNEFAGSEGNFEFVAGDADGAEIVFKTGGAADHRMVMASDGNVGYGALVPGSLTEWNFATLDLEFVDAGRAAATEQDWIEVQVNNNVGYIRVYAAK